MDHWIQKFFMILVECITKWNEKNKILSDKLAIFKTYWGWIMETYLVIREALMSLNTHVLSITSEISKLMMWYYSTSVLCQLGDQFWPSFKGDRSPQAPIVVMALIVNAENWNRDLIWIQSTVTTVTGHYCQVWLPGKPLAGALGTLMTCNRKVSSQLTLVV